MSADAPRYWRFYCEENVWHLAADARVGTAQRTVMFISNADKRVAVWRQSAASEAHAPVVWDYHVVLLARGPGGWRVWDLDSTLGVDLPVLDYLQATFLPSDPQFQPCFRLVDADQFRGLFASDRRHMRDSTGAFPHPPPPWAPVGGGEVAHNLGRFVDFADDIAGVVVDLPGLQAWLAAR